MKTLLPALLAVVLAPATAADADWLRCRTIADAASRLACYDAVKPAPAAAPGGGAGGSAPAPAATAPAVKAQQDFGLDRPRADTVDAIHSALPGPFEGWGPRQRFKLANGQVWQSTEGSSAFYALRDPKVTIRRAAMGSFMMEIEGVNQVIRVRRIE